MSPTPCTQGKVGQAPPVDTPLLPNLPFWHLLSATAFTPICLSLLQISEVGQAC